MGAQALANRGRQGGFDAAEQFERVWSEFVFAEHI